MMKLPFFTSNVAIITINSYRELRGRPAQYAARARGDDCGQRRRGRGITRQTGRKGWTPDIRLSRISRILNEVADPDLVVLVGSGPGLNINDLTFRAEFIDKSDLKYYCMSKK